jgi:hypothetical protein
MTGQEIIPPNGSAVMQAPERTAITPMEILNAAVQGGASVEALEKLLALQERWQANEARQAYNEALAAAKAELPSIRKNRRVNYEHREGGGTTDYAFEDLAEIAETVNPILATHGLSYRWRTESPPDAPVKVTCIVSHRLGYSEENTLEGPRDTSGKKNSLQAIGSTVTFLQRYTLKAALGLATKEDDDGRASGPPVREPRPEVKREAKPAIDQKTADQIARFVAGTKTDLLNCESEADVEKAWAKRRQKLEDLRKINPDAAARVDRMRVERIADFTGEVFDDFPGDRTQP